jgi:hypothetical protein
MANNRCCSLSSVALLEDTSSASSVGHFFFVLNERLS